MSLLNKKVKINVDKILSRKSELSKPFIDFVKDSEDKIFIAEQEDKYTETDMYILKGHKFWLFHKSDLEVVYDNS